MATFVMLHGGWEWSHVAGIVRAAGHTVFTPTLTGLGERAHLAHPGIDLDTYIQDVVNVIVYEDLHDVVLSGQSFGGIVITGVANAIPERLQQLIYVDAFVPQDGQSIFDLVIDEWSEGFQQAADEFGDGWMVPPPPFVNEPPVGPWAKGRYAPQPIKTMKQPVEMNNPLALRLPRTFISCTDKDGEDVFGPFASNARQSDDWGYHELATVHDAHATMPQEVAGLLMEIANALPEGR